MARIRPFRALRARAELAAQIAAPPYDVLSADEVRALAARQPQSFIRVTRADALLSDPSGDDQASCQLGRANLEELVATGALLSDAAPAFYLYEQTMGTHRQLGLVAGVWAEEYFSGLIKKHEHTRNRDLEGRIHHIEALGINAGPVFLTYRADPAVDGLLRRLAAGSPVVDFVAEDQVRHRLWLVAEAADHEALQRAFAGIAALYIADGHHRTEAGCQVARRRAADNPHHQGDEPYTNVMAVIFPHDQVQILAYNRVVHDLGGHSPEQLLSLLRKDFELVAATGLEPPEPTCFGMYLAGKSYQLRAKPGSFDAEDLRGRLDVAILQQNVLGPLLGIDDPKASARIEFWGGIRGTDLLRERVDRSGGVAFVCYPTQMDQVMAISDAGEVMPPKSTWFEPKLRSGLVIKRIDE